MLKMIWTEHLFEQAERLATPVSPGAPRQTDLRRAVSATYYGLFHLCLRKLADEFVGSTKLTQYALVYRSLNHKTVRDLCAEINKRSPSPKYARWFPAHGFDTGLSDYAGAFLDLYEMRHRADYDPFYRLRQRDAQYALESGRRAATRLDSVGADQRRLFLTLLLCPPR